MSAEGVPGRTRSNRCSSARAWVGAVWAGWTRGIRLIPARIANAALEEGVHIVGLSILSDSPMPLVKEVLRKMRDQGSGDVPVVVGIIPLEDAKAAGVARVYTPKDHEIQDIMGNLVDIAAAGYDRAA